MCSAVVHTNKVNFKESPNVIFFLCLFCMSRQSNGNKMFFNVYDHNVLSVHLFQLSLSLMANFNFLFKFFLFFTNDYKLKWIVY